MPNNTFDIVSMIDLAEVLNAVQQTRKEVANRFDLKGSGSTIELDQKEHRLVITSADDYKLKAVNDVLDQKLVRRKVPLKGLDLWSDPARCGINLPPRDRHTERHIC